MMGYGGPVQDTMRGAQAQQLVAVTAENPWARMGQGGPLGNVQTQAPALTQMAPQITAVPQMTQAVSTVPQVTQPTPQVAPQQAPQNMGVLPLTAGLGDQFIQTTRRPEPQPSTATEQPTRVPAPTGVDRYQQIYNPAAIQIFGEEGAAKLLSAIQALVGPNGQASGLGSLFGRTGTGGFISG